VCFVNQDSIGKSDYRLTLLLAAAQRRCHRCHLCGLDFLRGLDLTRECLVGKGVVRQGGTDSFVLLTSRFFTQASNFFFSSLFPGATDGSYSSSSLCLAIVLGGAGGAQSLQLLFAAAHASFRKLGGKDLGWVGVRCCSESSRLFGDGVLGEASSTLELEPEPELVLRASSASLSTNVAAANATSDILPFCASGFAAVPVTDCGLVDCTH